jgi:hypothetical protein
MLIKNLLWLNATFLSLSLLYTLQVNYFDTFVCFLYDFFHNDVMLCTLLCSKQGLFDKRCSKPTYINTYGNHSDANNNNKSNNSNNSNVKVPLWKRDDAKASALAQQYGLTPCGHLYRTHNKGIVLVTGQPASDDFYVVVLENEFIEVVNNAINNIPELAALKPIVVSGYNNQKDKGALLNFNKAVRDGGNVTIYVWFTVWGEVLVVGESRDSVNRIRKYLLDDMGKRGKNLIKAFKYFGKDNVFVIALVLPSDNLSVRLRCETALIAQLKPSCNVILVIEPAIHRSAPQPSGIKCYFLNKDGVIIYICDSMQDAANVLELDRDTIKRNLNQPHPLFNVVYIKNDDTVTKSQLSNTQLMSEQNFKDWFHNHPNKDPNHMLILATRSKSGRKLRVMDITTNTEVGIFPSLHAAAAHLKADRKSLRPIINTTKCYKQRYVITEVK